MKPKIFKIVVVVVILFMVGGLIGFISKPSENYSKASFLDSDITSEPAVLEVDLNEDTAKKPAAPTLEAEPAVAPTVAPENKETVPAQKAVAPEAAPVLELTGSPECSFDMPAQGVFSARPIKNTLGLKVMPNQKFRMALFFENTGNIPWFSGNTNCQNVPIVSLGTTRSLDRQSAFLNGNRVMIKDEKIDPGQIAAFEFEVTAPEAADIYREFFALVIENRTWMKDSEIMVDFHVGNTVESEEDVAKKAELIPISMKFSELDLSAPKSLEVDLSEQKMYVRIGDKLIRVFRTSTGKADTPTPTGNYDIEFKQQVRIAGGGTPYIMPKWQAFYKGAGIHALPSLGNAKLRHRILQLEPDEEAPTEWFQDDSLWTEAVDHIGRPVSHGCVRLLPDDAAFVFDFTDVGTPIAIHY
ncbi:MAG: hypothetical protein US89_C0007G0034 [Candidatus Peregrinibacteria bacterium GW2011_GWF2_38_29]|nr:MAG: hypothetical protein US89_C0007G0034 [Candidatus Peregrinibacteria bacterium GW2011_GWF2_38_29]